MISFISLCEIISVVIPDLKIIFWIATSVADADAITLLSNGVSTFFINGKSTLVNKARKLSNTPSWLVVFPVVPFNKILLFYKDLLTYIMSFISLFVSIITIPDNNESPLLIFLGEVLIPAIMWRFWKIFPDLGGPLFLCSSFTGFIIAFFVFHPSRKIYAWPTKVYDIIDFFSDIWNTTNERNQR